MTDCTPKRQKMEQTFPDSPYIEIILDNESFLIPKDMLISQTVLSKLYEQELSDPSCEIIIIENQQPAVFKAFLKYLNTRKIHPEDISNNLLKMAHEFLEEDLKTQCEAQLSKHFTQDNAIERLLLSVKHNCSKLELSAAKFIAQNYKEMKLREDFSLVYDNQKAVSAIFDSINKKLDIDIFSSLQSTEFRKVVLQFSHTFKDLSELDERCYFDSSYFNVRIFGWKEINTDELPHLSIGIEYPSKNNDYFCEIKGAVKLLNALDKKKFRTSFLLREDNEYVISSFIPWSTVMEMFEKDGSITVTVAFGIYE